MDMSEMILNLDFGGGPAPAPRRGDRPNVKHKRFLQRRSYLERKGFLHQKQARRTGPPHHPCPNAQPTRSKPDPPQPLPTPPLDTPRGLLLSECQSGLVQARARAGGKVGAAGASAKGHSPPPAGYHPLAAKPHKCVALDCEMVGTGQGGKRSELARCSVVGYEGDVVYDKYIVPPNPITDYRTRWSGIRRQHMFNATPFKVAQREILKVLGGKIVIGHAVHNDFKALNYFHPQCLTRDTSRIPQLNRRAGFPDTGAVSLKRLTKQLLHRDIQVGKKGHSSVEDARATMELYRLVESQLESESTPRPEEK